MNFVLEHEPAIRFICFLAVLTLMALWEITAPRRVLSVPKGVRWFANLGMAVAGTLAERVLLPLTAFGMAIHAGQHGWGLFNNLDLSAPLEAVLAVVVLDFVIYLQHVMLHAIPALWRLHMTHHSDMDFDFTTGVRFHPLEIALSMGIKVAAVALIGAPVLAVVLFEILLNATSLFNHGNVKLWAWLDRWLRLFVVTPEMHRVHHSIVPRETNSNFGFNLPWWDRLLGTYRAQPAAGHQGMTIGLSQFRDPARLTLGRLLALPFTGETGSYPLNRRGSGGESK